MSEKPEWLSERQIRVSQWLPQNTYTNIIENLGRLMNIDLRKILKKHPITSKSYEYLATNLARDFR